LESQAKSYQVDEIEGKRIMNKLEEAGVDEIKKFDFEFSEDEQEENRKEKEKLEKEFFENKEKELNNKILAEREREQIWQGCQGYQLNSFDCQW
jgi:isopropylmalate/homocitrate/citramalate synthase